MRLDISELSRVLACVVAQLSLFKQIKARQLDDPHLLVLRETVLQGGAKEVTIGEDGVLRLLGCLCVPNVDGLREKILEEAYSSRYSFHPGSTKLYRDMRQHYWWQRMKKDVVGCLLSILPNLALMACYSRTRYVKDGLFPGPDGPADVLSLDGPEGRPATNWQTCVSIP
ncbi:uncharacterized protein [Nicotiana tomentosiformis]|uniref:uncharacterized protein n=1 Tax=Nicotiana tomentosiformis TaxID=4098 RepID=UPI00388CB9EE